MTRHRPLLTWLGLLAGALTAAQGAVLVKEEPELNPANPDEKLEWYVGMPKLSATNAAATELVRSVDPGLLPRQIANAEDMVRRQPASPRAHAGLGSLYLQASRLDEAAQCFWRAARLEPANPGWLESLGFALLASGDHANGRDIYERLRQAHPKQARLQFNLAAAYYNLGEPDKAEAEMTEFLKFYPTGAKGLYNMGAIQFALGETREAQRYFEQCRDQQPRNVFVLCALARAYRKGGREQDFAAVREEILALVKQDQMEAILGQPQIPTFLLR